MLLARNDVIYDKQFRKGISILLSTENTLFLLTPEDIDKRCNELLYYDKTIGADETNHQLKHSQRQR